MLLTILLMLQPAPAPTGPDTPEPSVAPAVQPAKTDEQLEYLALNQSLLPSRLGHVIFDDPKMRGEIKRVGLRQGCVAVDQSWKKVGAKYKPALVPPTVAAIRKVVPEPVLTEASFLSFLSWPLSSYQSRIEDELEVTASETLQEAYAAMRVEFLAQTAQLPTSRNRKDNVLMPSPHLAAALSIEGAYDLSRPEAMNMACLDLLTPKRPRSETSIEPPPQ